MSEIDWSKAPNGATHCLPGAVDPWRRLADGYWDAWCQGGWVTICDPTPELYVGRPVEWCGAGRPKAGVTLEWKEVTGFQWVEAKLLFISDLSVILQRSDGFEWQMPTVKVVFRPIATPEQIAEDQRRDAAIAEMVSLAPMLDKGWARKVCQVIYDAGYRKPE